MMVHFSCANICQSILRKDYPGPAGLAPSSQLRGCRNRTEVFLQKKKVCLWIPASAPDPGSPACPWPSCACHTCPAYSGIVRANSLKSILLPSSLPFSFPIIYLSTICLSPIGSGSLVHPDWYIHLTPELYVFHKPKFCVNEKWQSLW